MFQSFTAWYEKVFCPYLLVCHLVYPRSAQGELNVLRQGSEDHTRGPDRTLFTVEPLYLFLSLKCLNRGRVRNIGAEIPWRWSLPECFTSSVGSFTSTLNVRVEGTSVFYVICESRGAHPLMLQGREINLLFLSPAPGIDPGSAGVRLQCFTHRPRRPIPMHILSSPLGSRGENVSFKAPPFGEIC